MPLLNAHNLELARLAPKNESRFVLQGVYVTPKETIVTDGYILGRVTLPDLSPKDFPVVPGMQPPADDWKPFLLTTTDALAIAKNIPKRSPIPIIKNAAVGQENGDIDRITLYTTDLERANPITVRRTSQTFPDVDRVMWDVKDETFAINVNAANLAAILEYVAKFNGSKRGTNNPPDCVLRFRSSDEAIRIDANNRDTQQTFVGLCVPTAMKRLTDTNRGYIAKAKRKGLPEGEAKEQREQTKARIAILEAEIKELKATL